MNKKMNKIAEPDAKLYIAVLLVFAVLTFLLLDCLYLAVAEAGAAVLLIIVNAIVSRRKRADLVRYIESVTYEADAAKNNTMLNFPLPIVAYLLDSGRVVWGNQDFFTICGRVEPSFGAYMSELVPAYSGKWLLDGKKRCPGLIELGGRRYQVHGNMIRGQEGQSSTGSMGITYWIDVTDYDDIKREHEASRPVVMLILIDNFDELTKNLAERARTDIRNRVEDCIGQWVEGKNGLLRRYDRDRYIYVCERRYYDEMEKEKFRLVSDVHSITATNGIHATVCIGVGYDGFSYEEDFRFASMSLDMALSRGGDQAVTRDRINFQFYGGRGAEVETRTKVKSRVVANALSSFIRDASVTYIMGHRFADMDCLGAAAGICCMARKLDRRARIVMNPKDNACGPMIEALKRNKEYADIFITPTAAMVAANSRSLLVVVDTNRPDNVDDEALLQTINRVAVIDHHRRAASYIDNAAVTFHEPYASSACELVTELLQEIAEPKDILRCEAEALLGGITMDTKNFTIRTGERTFDAAAFLRRCGADTTEVKRLLQSDFDSTVARYSILQRAELYRDNICVSVVDEPMGRVVAAQAADEMLNISGVECSLVLYPTEDGGANVSARSIGSLNVQVLLEKLGGGGNKSAAGAQMKNITVEEARERLAAAIDEYLGG